MLNEVASKLLRSKTAASRVSTIRMVCAGAVAKAVSFSNSMI